MKSVLAIAALSGSLASAQYFGVTSARSASPIHYLSMNAGGEQIYLGGAPETYCPDSVQQQGGCPEDVCETNFSLDTATGRLSLGAIVPGGQQVYVEPNTGAVKYTQAHSAAVPQGAVTDGWSITRGQSFDTLQFAFGLVACQDGDKWPVYGLLPDVTVPNGCLGFDALATNETSAAAWQYE